ncbi:unnamed protein product [Spirodela intermedia]|uniref:Peptide deformylase n=1 Tax=Spirodela intermedia TaxID=51605 RepID=A0A7I8JSH6_SPIIN|nr:unnamed protein product [Spirodela intermedia]CAA6673074.1 unnamed protein product [Spirodela intermedia]
MAARLQTRPLCSHCSLFSLQPRRGAYAATRLSVWPGISSVNHPGGVGGVSESWPWPSVGFSQSLRLLPVTADLQFESPLKIVEYPDPRLRARNKSIATFDDNLKRLVEEMFDVMYKTNGIGLSAPKLYSKKTLLFNEGCLSFPGIYADVERPASVKIDARDVTGARFTANLSELPARVFQHEYDHLQGTLFFDRMTEDVLDSIRPALQALEKKYEDRTGVPSPERIVNYTRRKKPLVLLSHDPSYPLPCIIRLI